METGISMNSAEMDIQKFWSRRIAGAHHEEVTTGDVLLENQLLFPPAQVQAEDELNVTKSRPSSPFLPTCDADAFFFKEDVCNCTVSLVKASSSSWDETEVLDGADLGDIPCKYRVPRAQAHEMMAVGVYIDPRIIPGFKYNIRSLDQGKKKYLFGGVGREVESIGRGYSRRITLRPLPGNKNSNPDYFWTDSSVSGFAFSLQVVSPQDKFTLLDADQQPVAHLELTHIQGPQVEISQAVLQQGRIEKIVRVRATCKVDWFHEQDNNPIAQISGLCVAVLDKGKHSVVTHIRDVHVGHKHTHATRYGYTLIPGTCSSLRSLRVSGQSIKDVPTSYTIVGIEPYHLPVIGTYIDERIVPGFHYRIQLGGCGKKLFNNRALRLDSIGRGYAKRITFQPDRLNSPDNHFWSDSHPEGFGFEISAIRPGMEFTIRTKEDNSIVGHAAVFRDDCAPQVELHHSTVEEKDGRLSVMKRIQVTVKCEVSLDMSTQDKYTSHIMRVSGTAILYKYPSQNEAKVIKIEDVGLDSQLSMIFTNQLQQLVFYPADKLQP